MNTRTDILKELRGDALGNLDLNTLSEELFQNEVLRPILKLQNDLFIALFKNHIDRSKLDFSTFSIDQKLKTIDNIMQKDFKFRSILLGMIIGLLTTEEYEYYAKQESGFNKRIMGMLIERLKSQLQLFN